jgi:hypothetical protein
MFPIIFFTIALLLALFKLSRLKKRTTAQTIEVLLVYFMVSNIGIDALFGAYFQIFQAQQTAGMIGFTFSPFEFEVAMANVGIGIAALLSIFWRGRYLLGPVIASTIFIYGAAYGHFVQAAKGNTAPYNGGIFLWFGDIIIPTIIVILAILYYNTVISKTK